jgi:hypothetical protein
MVLESFPMVALPVRVLRGLFSALLQIKPPLLCVFLRNLPSTGSTRPVLRMQPLETGNLGTGLKTIAFVET